MGTTENKLKESEEKFRSLVEITSDWIWEVDNTGTYTYSNPKVKDILGYEVNEVMGKTPFDFMPPDEAEKVLALFQKAIEMKEPINILKNKNIHKDGYSVTLETSGVPFFDDNGTLKGYRGIDREVTEKLEAERKLKESEQLNRSLIEGLSQTGIGISIIDYNFNIIYQSQYLKEQFGEHQKRNCFEFYLGREKSCEDCQMMKAIQNNKIEKAIITAPNNRTYEVIAAPIPNPSGTIERAAEVIIDITERIESEQRLKESELKFRDLYEKAPTAYFSIGNDKKILRFNRTAEKLLGYTEDELLKMKVFDLYADTENGIEKAKKVFKQFLDGESIKDVELQMKNKDGNHVWVSLYVKHIIDQEGKVIESRSMILDITERRKAEEALKESEEKFRTITEQSFLGISIMQDNIIKYANNQLAQTFGYSVEEIMNWEFGEFLNVIHSEDRDMVAKQARKKQLGESDSIDQYQFRGIKKNGDIIWLEIYSKSIIYDGKPADFVTIHDITDKKISEQKIQESEEKYRNLFNNAPFAIVLFNIEGTILDCNDASNLITGYSKEELNGKNFKDFNFYVDVNSASIEEREEKIRDGKSPKPREVLLHKKDGSQFWARTNIEFVHMRDKTYIQAIIQDVSEQKESQIKLEESESKFRDLYEEAPIAYFSIGPDNSILRVNNAAERLLGFSNEEFLKLKVFDLYSDSSQGLEKAKSLFSQFLDGDSIKDVELEMNNKQGDPIWVSLSVKPIFNPEGNVVESRSMVLDITDRKIAQEEIKNSYKKLEELEYIINNSPGVGFLWKNSEGWPVEFVSENVTQFGYTPEDFYSGKVIFGEIIHPDDLERVSEEVNNYSNEDVNHFVQEYRIITKSGEPRWLDDRSWIRRDSNGNVTHFQGIVLDITDRKITEEALKQSENKYKESYDRANFYKDLFAHDMSNILQVINSSAELILFQLGDSEKSKNIANIATIIKKQIERGAKLISNVRTLSELKDDEVITKRVGINKFIKNAITFVKKAYERRNIKISFESVSKKHYTNANELLQDVFENVLINSIKYNENSTIEISIKISKQEIDSKEYIKIEFIDNGIGVSDERKEVIFLSGNRELKGSKGMGLGLSLVSKILNIFKGEIQVEDKIKGDYTKGSNFIILLPEEK